MTPFGSVTAADAVLENKKAAIANSGRRMRGTITSTNLRRKYFFDNRKRREGTI
jgi:hypothetical protein